MLLANLLPARQQLLRFYDSVTSSHIFNTHAQGYESLKKRFLNGMRILKRLFNVTKRSLPVILLLRMKEWPGRFELRYIQLRRSDRYRWFYLELFLETVSVGLARTKPICSVEEDSIQHEGHEYPCPLVYLEMRHWLECTCTQLRVFLLFTLMQSTSLCAWQLE